MAVSRHEPSKKPAKSTEPFLEFSKYENGRKRSLKFDVNALADFEQETGMGFAQLMRQKAAFASARALLWAGLKHEDRGLTIDGTGTLIGQYIIDEDVPRGTHTIDTLLQLVIKVVVDQGALGRAAQVEPDADEGELSDEGISGPNALTSGTDSSTPTIQDN